MLKFTAAYTDFYELTMAQVYFLKGRKNERAVFDYFFRKSPFAGGYTIFAGLENLLDDLEKLRFTEHDIDYLKKQGFDEEFLKYLQTFRFRGDIRSVPEGEIVFPNEPVLQVDADIIEAQIIESLLLNILNFQSLIATKARRMKSIAGDKVLLDFGLRRAQGAGALHASRAAVVGGFSGTSNVVAGKEFDLPVSGTMAHSYIQSFDDELTAFRHYAEIHPDATVLLVDTYDSIKSGVPNAITVAKEMEQKGQRLKGIRLDSGDLAYLAKKSRAMLDEAGLEYVTIAASNQLDEHIIKSLLEQKAPIDVFGVGTSLVTGKPDSALDGVYKLSESGGKPRIKISENTEKITLPSRKQVWRLTAQNGRWSGADVIALQDETNIRGMIHPVDITKSMTFENLKLTPLLNPVMKKGNRVSNSKTVSEISAFSTNRFAELPLEFKRFNYPHIYKVGISYNLRDERNELIQQHIS